MKNVEDILPLTPMQHLMLMHSLRTRGSCALVNQFRYRVLGEFDVARFEAAWQGAGNRHQALRLAYLWQDVPHPLQVVRSSVSLPVSFVDLSRVADDERERRLRALMDDDRARGFDLRRAPLLRVTVARLGPREHLMLLTRHHLILDLWSVEVLFEEVFAAYDAPERTFPEPGRFRDYVAWIQGQDPELAKSHWRQYLAGLAGPSPVFTTSASRGEWTAAGQPVVTRSLDGASCDALARASRALGVTRATLLQGAVALAVAAWTGRDDVVFGLTVAGRPRDVPEVERTLGSFISNVPVRFAVERARPMPEALAGLQREQAARLAFEHVSATDIQRWSGLPADVPLFDLLVLLQSPTAGAPADAGLRVEPVTGPFDSAMPMTLAIEQPAGGVALTAVYDPALVRAGAAGVFVDSIVESMRALAERPHATVAELLPSVRDAASPVASPRVAASLIPAQAVPQPEIEAENAGAAAVLLDIWRRTLGNPDVGPDDDFFALGGTSIQAAIAFEEIERRLGKDLPLATLFEAGSVRKLGQALDLPPAPPSSLVGIQRFGARPVVLAASGIGGNVVGLAQIARTLGQSQPFFGLQSKGLDDDTAPADEVERIAAHFLAESEQARGGPVVLLGICFGASVMLEMAHQLAAAGRAPELLVALDPVFDDVPVAGDVAQGGGVAATRSVSGFLIDRVRLYWRQYCALDARSRREWLAGKGRLWAEKLRQGDLLAGYRGKLRRRRVAAANLAAARRYRPRRYAGQVRVLLTSDRDLDPASDPRLAWLSHVSPGAPARRIPGTDTGDALTNQAPAIADALRGWIDEIPSEERRLPESV